MESLFREIACSVSSAVEDRIFLEYGAMFATKATPPPTIIFASAVEVEAFQSSLRVDRAVFGEHEITLQTDALCALGMAVSRVAQQGRNLRARAADAGARSYDDTVRLWTRNVTRGLEHWQSLGRITTEHAQSISARAPVEQVAPILNLEDSDQLFFGTFFDRSILYSVAAPGASQHLSLLAFDVAEYEDSVVEEELALSGWYRTVPNDLPHFTYLGHARDTLPGLGLQHTTRTFGEHVYGFWVPDLERLRQNAHR